MEKSPPPSVIADKLDPEIITVAPGIACPYALVIVPCIVVWAKEDSHISASHARNINDTRKALLYFLIEQSVLDNNEDSGWTIACIISNAMVLPYKMDFMLSLA